MPYLHFSLQKHIPWYLVNVTAVLSTVSIHSYLTLRNTINQNNIYKFSSYCTGNTLSLRYNAQSVNAELEVAVNLRPKVSRPVCLGVGLPSGAHDQIFVFCLTIAGFLKWGILSDERMGL
jgi:hypothetical protein